MAGAWSDDELDLLLRLRAKANWRFERAGRRNPPSLHRLWVHIHRVFDDTLGPLRTHEQLRVKFHAYTKSLMGWAHWETAKQQADEARSQARRRRRRRR
ncbi:hypothetical protein BS78_05G253800 [Paspalum vaginatum]|nr:hypothetical protein BS78_05G253800 [Paspalum vaginatum]KAJ1276923.1 hypothetical protein BS78_05G253800 [Paspalum vaginatum]